MANEFVIKINKDSDGNELSLSNMPIEAVDALNIFIKSLSDFAKLHRNKNELKFSLKEGCIETVLSYPDTDTEIEKEIQEILEGSSENNDSIKIFKDIQDKIKLNGLDYSIIRKVNNVESNITDVFKAKNFSYKRGTRNSWTDEILFLEGYLFDNGGKVNANLHLTSEEIEYKVDCSIDESRQVKNFLFETVFLVVVKSSKKGVKSRYKFVDSYPNKEKFDKYKTLYNKIYFDKTLEKYDLIHQTLIDIIDSDKVDNGEILKIMRLYNFEFSDRGVLRTILMTLKPIISDEKKLSEMYSLLANTLREKSKNNLI